MNWTTIENAIVAWMLESGLDASKMHWSQQNADRPAAPYIAMRLTGITKSGSDWNTAVDNPSPSAGEEITVYTRGPREATLEVQCFSVDGFGAASALAYLTKVATAMGKGSVRAALDAAGVGIGNVTPVQSIDGFIGDTIFEPRAIMSVNLFLAEETSENTTYIETVEVENLTTGDEFVLP